MTDTPVLVAGRTGTLDVRWFEYAGGPLVNVGSVTITITPLAGGAAVVGPTSTGVLNPVTGVNVYNWAVPGALPPGDYLVVWDGTSGGDPVQASEVVAVVVTATGMLGVCEPWTPTWQCALPTGSEAVTGTALQAASEVLYALSGRQFGLCQVTVRPCRSDCWTGVWPFGNWAQFGQSYPMPLLFRGLWYNVTCGTCQSGCSCSFVSEARLPGPVHDVVQVKVDGVPLVKGTDYRLDDYRILVRLGGEVWPLCNDLNLADTEVGTWSATFRQGQAVPTIGQLAVGILASEFTKLLMCDSSCALPKPVQSIARQGISVTFLDPNEVFKDGRTGLYLPDLFIQTTNPGALRRRSRVFDIDSLDTNRQLGTG